jgi:CrcB protein
MTHLLAVAAGGALGALCRYGVNGLLYPVMGGRFPLGTLSVNVLGSLLIGVLYVLIVEKSPLSLEWRNFLMVGFVGSLTTFSTFSLDALALWQNGHPLLAAFYVLASVLLCLVGIAAAVFLTRLF